MYAKDGYQPNLARTAIILGCLVVITTIAIGYSLYSSSRQLLLKAALNNNLALARLVAEQTELQTQSGTIKELVGHAGQIWNKMNKHFEQSYVCIIDSSGTLQYHSLVPELAGQSVAKMSLDPRGFPGPQDIGDLATRGEEWTGDFTARSGQSQAIAFVPIPTFDCMIAVHVPSAEIESEIRAALLPWAIALAATTLLLLPLSLGLFCRSCSAELIKRKASEESLRESQQKFDAFFADSPAGLAIVDEKLCYSKINETLASINGLTVAEHLGRTVGQLLPELASEVEPMFKGVLAEGKAFLNIEVNGETLAKPGVPRQWMVSYFPMKAFDGSVKSVGVVVIETTERKQAEDALRERELYFRLFSQSSGDCFWNWDMVKNTVERSSGFERSFGYSKNDILEGIEWWMDRLHPDDRERVLEHFSQATASSQPSCEYQYRFRNRNGSYSIVHDHVCLIRDDTGKVVRSLGTMHDITERKRVEDALQENAELLKAVHKSNPELQFILDGSHNITSYHAQDHADLFRSPKIFIGKKMQDMLPEDVGKKFQAVFDTADANRSLVTIEYNLPMPAGDRTYEARIVLLPDQRWLVTVRDITSRKRSEEEVREARELLRQRELELIHASRLSLVGEMAASVSHELGQPLFAIANYVRSCQLHVEQGAHSSSEKLINGLESIAKCAERSKDIVTNMGKFCSRNSSELSSVLVSDLIIDTVKMLDFELQKSGLKVKYKLDPELHIPVFVNNTQIQQVFVNIIRNACDVFDEASVDDAQLIIGAEIRGGECLVSFEDNGPGLKAETEEQLFESFFTTKRDGMGLGLAISRRIVEAYDGRIWIRPNPVQGVTFFISLPLSTEN